MIHTATWPNSKNIESAEYDDEKKTMDVEFKRGAEYRYFDVPRETWDRFVKAEAAGS